MKIRILIVAITVVVLTVLSAAGVFIYKNLTKTETKAEGTPIVVGEGGSSVDEEKETEPKKEEILKETRLIKDDFEITLPPGWEEAASPPESVLVMGIDSREDVSAGIFKKLDFRTNFSIKSKSRQQYTGISDLGAYVESIKTSLAQAIPGINFTREEQKTISGNRAIFVECESMQQGADFKTLLVFIETSDLVVYALSFNSFLDSWAKYQDSFYQIAESFKLKYKLEF